LARTLKGGEDDCGEWALLMMWSAMPRFDRKIAKTNRSARVKGGGERECGERESGQRFEGDLKDTRTRLLGRFGKR
jgi:hypothetical protein